MAQVNLGGLLAWEFLLMHWVEVRRWQDYKKFGSVNEVGCLHYHTTLQALKRNIYDKVLLLSDSCSVPFGLWVLRQGHSRHEIMLPSEGCFASMTCPTDSDVMLALVCPAYLSVHFGAEKWPG